MWWVPHAKRHVPMRPTWGNGGLTVGNSGGGGGRLFPLGERNATLRSNNTLSIVALDGRQVPALLLALLAQKYHILTLRCRLYERGFSSQEWMHPDRYAPLSY